MIDILMIPIWLLHSARMYQNIMRTPKICTTIIHQFLKEKKKSSGSAVSLKWRIIPEERIEKKDRAPLSLSFHHSQEKIRNRINARISPNVKYQNELAANSGKITYEFSIGIYPQTIFSCILYFIWEFKFMKL